MTPAERAERVLEATRWRLSAEYAVPLDRLTATTEPDLRRQAEAALVKAGVY